MVHKTGAFNETNFYGTSPYSWTGNSIEILPNSKLAISAHMAKVGGVKTVGQVKIVDFDLNELMTIENPDFPYSDQFGYAMISTNLTILDEIKPCLVIGSPVATYGFHSNAGAIQIFNSETFEYYGKLHSDRALGRFGRSFDQNEDYLFIGAPRYHEEANALKENGAVFALSKQKNLYGHVTEICSEGGEVSFFAKIVLGGATFVY